MTGPGSIPRSNTWVTPGDLLKKVEQLAVGVGSVRSQIECLGTNLVVTMSI